MATFLFNTKTLQKMIEQAPPEANVIGININYPIKGSEIELKLHAVLMKFTETGSSIIPGGDNTAKLDSNAPSAPGVFDCPKPPDCGTGTVKSIISTLNLPLPLPE